MFKFVVLFCAVFAIVHGNTTQVSRCLSNNSGPLPINAYIEGCSAPPCRLPQLQDAVIHVDFQTRSKTGKFILQDTSSFIASALFWWLSLLILALRSCNGVVGKNDLNRLCNIRAKTRPVRSMRTLATAYLGIFPIPYDLGQNAVTCNFLNNASCPVEGGQLLKSSLRMYIESFFPVGTQVTVEFRIVAEDNNESLMCLRVPIAIAPPVA